MSGPPKHNKEKPIETRDRTKILEEVFKKYHKKLIQWCRFKLLKRYGILLSDTQSDAEDVVAYVYEELLRGKTTIDLSRSDTEISGFLNKALDYAISNFIDQRKAEKRNPKGGVVSLEEIIGDKDEEELPATLKQYFAERPDEKEEMYSEIEAALSRLESRDKKMADIIRKRYREGKSDSEIAEDYNETKANIHSRRKKAEAIIRNIIKGRIKSDLSITKERIMKPRISE